MPEVSSFEGKECSQCQATLRVVKVDPALPIKFEGDETLRPSTYECEGPERHRFEELTDLRRLAPGAVVVTLVPKSK